MTMRAEREREMQFLLPAINNVERACNKIMVLAVPPLHKIVSLTFVVFFNILELTKANRARKSG